MMPVTPLSSSSETSGSSMPRTRTSGATPMASAVLAIAAMVSRSKIECCVSMKTKSWPVALAMRAISGERPRRTVMPSATPPACMISLTGLVSLVVSDCATCRPLCGGCRILSCEAEQAGRIVDQYALAHGRVRRPLAEQVVEPNRAHLVVERQVREVAAPDQLVRHLGHQRLGEGLYVDEARVMREAIDAGELHPAALGAIVGQPQELLETRLLGSVLGFIE